MDKTTIQVSREIRDFLNNLGNKGDSYDDILRKCFRTVYDWDEVYKVSVPVQTENGGIYVDMILPKNVGKIKISPNHLADGIRLICEENGIEYFYSDE